MSRGVSYWYSRIVLIGCSYSCLVSLFDGSMFGGIAGKSIDFRLKHLEAYQYMAGHAHRDDYKVTAASLPYL